MKALQITKHKTNLTNILMDIYKDSLLGPVLGFKGGTAAMLFYNLPRFSTDLDFDLTAKYKKDSEELKKIVERMTKVLSTKYDIQDQSEKYNTLFWLVSYGFGLAKIKIEVSTRDIPHNHYELKSLYGVKIKTLQIKDMVAHKMVAIIDRKSLANRDLFDVHYFLSTPYATEINYDVIRHRTGKNPQDFYKDLYYFLGKIDPKSVLSGLGEVLSKSQKDWAKTKLIEELRGLVERQMEIVL